MNYQWVIARYGAKSANGISALSELSKGFGYILINKDRGAHDGVVVAFKRPLDAPLPHHLDVATEVQATRFEETARLRSGLHRS